MLGYQSYFNYGFGLRDLFGSQLCPQRHKSNLRLEQSAGLSGEGEPGTFKDRVLLNKYPDKGLYLAILGGVAMGVGALTYGRRVTNTVGKNITPLDLPAAFSAQFAAAFGVHFFSVLGIPVSTSQAIVGAVIGVGLTKGVRAVSRQKITIIAVGWIVAPLCAAVFAALTYQVLKMLLS